MSVQVRAARHEDVQMVVTAVRQLLVELAGTSPDAPAMEAATRSLLEDGEAGALLVAEADDDTLVGVLAASWQTAIHVPGRYGLIQDLWVESAWRSSAIGAALVDAFAGIAREQGVARIEVGLPREQFAQFDATQRFYLSNGFTPNGPRMRRILS